MHPPEPIIEVSVSGIEYVEHVETGQPRDQGSDLGLEGKATFYLFESFDLFFS